MKKYLDQYGPRLFQRFPDLRAQLKTILQNDLPKLRKYPDVIRALYQGHENEIPEELRIEPEPPLPFNKQSD